MENKKLLKFLLNDLNELEELIDDKDEGYFDELEMEFLQSRIKGAKRLINLLVKSESVSKDLKQNKSPEHTGSENSDKEESLESNKQKEEVQPTETEIDSAKYNTEEEQNTEHTESSEITEESVQYEEIGEEEEVASEIQPVNDEVDLEDEEKTEALQRLGDSFLAGKSINDLVTDQNKLEFKLSNRPVANIKAAIGINDRFQYIRELFEGNTEKFLETVTALDNMEDLKDAVHFLHENFKWKKNETSLKFVNLVKRRFSNE